MTMFGNPLSVNFVDNDEFNILLMSLLVYVWFILTTKLDISWNIAILVLLSMYFLYESSQINKYKIISNDNVLDQNKKKELINSFNDLQKYVLIGIFGITIVGTAFYSNEKQVQTSLRDAKSPLFSYPKTLMIQLSTKTYVITPNIKLLRHNAKRLSRGKQPITAKIDKNPPFAFQ